MILMTRQGWLTGTDPAPSRGCAGLSVAVLRNPDGVAAVSQGSSKITQLPPYLTVQLVRFFYKRDVQQKSKILRKVCTVSAYMSQMHVVNCKNSDTCVRPFHGEPLELRGSLAL